MSEPLVIRGRYKSQAFVPDEPMPQVEGTAELIVFPTVAAPKPPPSIFDLFGKAPHLRSAEEIDRQIREEHESWGG
jgi:hypothetical protein